MKFKILAISIFSAVVMSNLAISAPKPPAVPQSYVGCSDGGNGLAANGNNNNPNAPGQSGKTRRGNNGGGNGGEAVDIYWTVSAGNLVHIEYVCYSTESEDSEGGGFYVNGNYRGPAEDFLNGPLATGELDPGH